MSSSVDKTESSEEYLRFVRYGGGLFFSFFLRNNVRQFCVDVDMDMTTARKKLRRIEST